MNFSAYFEINCPECDTFQTDDLCVEIGDYVKWEGGVLWNSRVIMGTCGCLIDYDLFGVYMKAYANKLSELGFYD